MRFGVSEFPLGDLPQHVDVKRLIRDQLLQPGVLRLEFLTAGVCRWCRFW
jgi:hypothetical protein